jgi:hypothetical protein
MSKMTIKELNELIEENFTNKLGVIDISGLEFNHSMRMSNLKINGFLHMDDLTIKGDLFQQNRSVGGSTYISTHKTKENR